MNLEKEVLNNLSKLNKASKILVAVSGGADSVALLYILNNLGYSITLAHLNHNLRGLESDGDEIFVKNLAKSLGLKCFSKKISISKSGNLENNARIERYAFLQSILKKEKLDFLALAHHLDDQVETVLLHLLRGSSAKGLSGMSVVEGNLIRPLLSIEKQDILNYLSKNKISYRNDSTNNDTKYKRNLLRHNLIPSALKKDANFKMKIIILSEKAKKEFSKQTKILDKWIKKNILNNSFLKEEFLKLDEVLQGELILRLVKSREDIYKKEIDELRKFIEKSKVGSEKKISNIKFHIQSKSIIFEDLNNKIKLDGRKKLKKEIKWNNNLINYVGDKTLYVRSWKYGDFFYPRNSKKKLKDFFIDNKIAKIYKKTIPIIVDENDKVLSISILAFDRDSKKLKENLQINKII